MKVVTALAAVTAGAPPELVEVLLENILDDPANIRKDRSPEALRELAGSMERLGQQVPVVLRPADQPGKYRLIDGHGRCAAARMIGWTHVLAVVSSRNLSPLELTEAMLACNDVRESLNEIDKGLSYLALMQERGWTAKQLSAAIGKSEATISRTLKLLNLSPALQQRIRAGELTAAEGYEQASQKRSPSAQVRIPCKAATLSATLSVKPDAKPEEVVAALEAIAKAGRKALASGEVKCASDLAKFLKAK